MTGLESTLLGVVGVLAGTVGGAVTANKGKLSKNAHDEVCKLKLKPIQDDTKEIKDEMKEISKDIRAIIRHHDITVG